MIRNLLNLTQQAIDQRFQQEIPDLEKLVQSRLKLKNPADLTSDSETLILTSTPSKDGTRQEKLKGSEADSCAGMVVS